ncbi:DNA polymerase III subunit gamma/tau [Alloscardovia omnicolens]|uniref:DNA polymerase III subunit gamma/tau n=1 Tax=Alloscardovia omnicolens TaxID=419015 RepID=UPI003A71CA6F
MALALYRRYRPDTFDGVIGQDHVTKPLSRALDEGKLTHAYLFSGPRGCGKTSSARILARCINCVQGPTSHPCGECESCRDLSTNGPGSIDVVEIDAASHGSVDDARELRERATFAPARDRYKIFILDEAHMVTGSAFNALLKIVEEPPEHVMFIFATTEPDKVIGTIRSRTHHYPFRLVPPEIMGPYLEQVCHKEGIKPQEGVLKLAMRAGGGSMRDTLSVLDQLMVGSVDGVITYDDSVALLGFTPDTLIRDAMNAIIERNGQDLYSVIEKVVTGGFDPRKFVEDLLAYVRDLLVLAIAGSQAQSALHINQSEHITEDMQQQVARLNLHQLDVMAQRINTALSSMSGTMSPRMRLELLAAQLLVAEEPASAPMQTQSAPQSSYSSTAHTAQVGKRSEQLSPRARAKAAAAAEAAQHVPAQTAKPQEVQQNTDSAHQSAEKSVPENTTDSAPQLKQDMASPAAQRADNPLDPAQAQKQWEAVIDSLPQKIRAVVSSDHIPHVELSERAGRHLMMLTFATPLSQHAFGLAVSSEPVHGETTLQKILNVKLLERYGVPVVVAPAPRTADGQTVTPLRDLTPAQRAQVKAQVAQMAAQAALASMHTMSATQLSHTQGSAHSDKTASPASSGVESESGDREETDSDSAHPERAHHDDAQAMPTQTSAVWSQHNASDIDPWADTATDHEYGQIDNLAQSVTTQNIAVAHTGESAVHEEVSAESQHNIQRESYTNQSAADSSADYFMHGDSSSSQSDNHEDNVERESVAEHHNNSGAPLQKANHSYTSGHENIGMNPASAQTDEGAASSEHSPHGSILHGSSSHDSSPSTPSLQPQVNADEDQYSLDDEQMESQAALSVQEIEKIFNAKKTEEFAADDDRNPLKSS